MFINEPVLKGNKKKPKTMAKNINQYEFSSPLQRKKQQSSIQQPYQKSPKLNLQAKALRTKTINIATNNETQFDADTDKMYFQGETEFQDNLVEDLNVLIKKWQDNLNTVKSDLGPYEKIGESQSQIRAFQHCVNLLQAQLSQAQASHESTKNLINKKMLQIDDYKLRILKQIKQLHQQNGNLIKQNQQLEEEQKQKQKQAKNKKMIYQRLQQQKQKVEKLKASLLQCKQDSYGQKNEFIQIQSQQFKLQSQINKLQEEQRKDQQQNIITTKYYQLLKIKQKIIFARDNLEEEIRPHLERKIQKMAKLRSQLINLDEALQTCCIKVQDQNIIIEALKEKSYHEEVYQQDQQNLYEIYRKKYSQIYFGDKSEKGNKDYSNDWKDYSTYLQHLINKNRGLNSRVYTQIPQHYSKRKPISSHHNGSNNYLVDQFLPAKKNSRVGRQILDLRPNNFSKRDTRDKFFGNANNSTKISKNPENYKSERIPSKKIQKQLKLPKLVKVQGRADQQQKLKNKVKQGILKNNNKQSDFQLESVHSNDSKVSGEIIQVEFHKK